MGAQEAISIMAVDLPASFATYPKNVGRRSTRGLATGKASSAVSHTAHPMITRVLESSIGRAETELSTRDEKLQLARDREADLQAQLEEPKAELDSLQIIATAASGMVDAPAIKQPLSSSIAALEQDATSN
jgi:hypothetical protein